ncbi:MAG TPA: hypothetical protein VHC22_00235 [Pirellulales bacterium]|nr:hypothetical protein [Pirellulales bacterium]
MNRRLPQFSIATLLLTIAAVAVVLALMLRVPTQAASLKLLGHHRRSDCVGTFFWGSI